MKVRSCQQAVRNADFNTFSFCWKHSCLKPAQLLCFDTFSFAIRLHLGAPSQPAAGGTGAAQTLNKYTGDISISFDAVIEYVI